MNLTEKEKAVKNQYGQMICMFLAEGLRTRKITLQRAADLGEKILVHYKLLCDESHFLSLVKELSKDFEELVPLQGKMQQVWHTNQNKELETGVREFVIKTLPVNMPLAMEILQDVGQGQPNWDEIKQKYPQLTEFLNHNVSR